MSRSFFHHISLLCYMLSLPPMCSSSLCHYCMVTQTLQRCHIWMIYRMTHTPIGHCPCLKSFFSTLSTAHTHTRWQAITSERLYMFTSTQTPADLALALQTVSCHDRCIKHLFSGSALHLRSWLNKQADFNGVPFTPPWLLLHKKCVHTQ